jgi:tryptophan-rich sensory protein
MTSSCAVSGSETTGSETAHDNRTMLWNIALILFVLWLLVWLGLHVLGAAVHILLILAIIMAVVALVKRA